MNKTLSFTITGMTLQQVRDEIKRLGVPDNAVIDYAGCGTHDCVIEWEVPMSETEEALRREAYTRAEEKARHANDRREVRKGLPIIDETKLGF